MVKLEIFSGDPPCPGCVAIIGLAERVAAKYPGELELSIFQGSGVYQPCRWERLAGKTRET